MSKRFVASFTPTAKGSPVFVMVVKLTKLNNPTALYGPVTVTVTHDNKVDRAGHISDCSATTKGLTCRAF